MSNNYRERDNERQKDKDNERMWTVIMHFSLAVFSVVGLVILANAACNFSHMLP